MPYSVFLLVIPPTYVELLHFCVSYLWTANYSIKSLLLSFIFDFQELLNISLPLPTDELDTAWPLNSYALPEIKYLT